MLRILSHYFFLIMIGLCSISVSAKSATANSFDQLLFLLNSGKAVRAVIHLDRCQLKQGTRLLTKTGGVPIDFYTHFDMPMPDGSTKETISTSATVFSITDVMNLGPVNNYLRLYVFKDNTADVLAAILNIKTNEKILFGQYTCNLSFDESKSGIVFHTTGN